MGTTDETRARWMVADFGGHPLTMVTPPGSAVTTIEHLAELLETHRVIP